MAWILIILIAASVLALRYASRWLDSPDAPAKAEAIVVLGNDPTRALAGADLFKAGYAPRVLLSVPYREPRFKYLEQEGISYPWFEVASRTILRNRGVPENAIATFGNELRSTAAEAKVLASLEPRLASLLVVTSPYHVRRARIILRDALPGVELKVVASTYEKLPERWWTEQASARNVMLELAKLAFYVVGGRL